MIKITIKDKESGINKDVMISKTLNGDYMLTEHPDIDVIIVPTKNKVLVLPKQEQNDFVYSLQDKLFDYMSKKGVILPESVQAGNIYGSLQGLYTTQPADGQDPLQVVVYTVANFIETERPIFKYEKEFEDAMEKELFNPGIEDSTELGEVPQEIFKGSIPKYGFPTRGIYRYNY